MISEAFLMNFYPFSDRILRFCDVAAAAAAGAAALAGLLPEALFGLAPELRQGLGVRDLQELLPIR